MSRWLVHFLCSVLMMCYGVCAVAQPSPRAQPMSASSSVVPAPTETATNPAESGHGEQPTATPLPIPSAFEGALDAPELLADLRVATPVRYASSAGQRAGLLSLIPPYLAGLERPPRHRPTA